MVNMIDQIKQRFLILGGSSRIASMMIKSWDIKSSIEVISQYRQTISDIKTHLPFHRQISFDPLNYNSSIVKKLSKIDTVICLAGISSGTKSELFLNTQLAEASLKLSEDIGAKRLFYASSAAIYGYGNSLTEQDTTNPVSNYGQSKLEAERFLEESNSCVSIISMRMGNALFADSITGQLTPPPFENLINLDFFPDGRTLCRSYIDPISLSRIINSLSDLSLKGFNILNIASIEEIEADQLLNKLKVPWIKNNRAKWDGQKITISTRLLHELLINSNLSNCWTKSLYDWSNIKKELN